MTFWNSSASRACNRMNYELVTKVIKSDDLKVLIYSTIFKGEALIMQFKGKVLTTMRQTQEFTDSEKQLQDFMTKWATSGVAIVGNVVLQYKDFTYAKIIKTPAEYLMTEWVKRY